ncbi:MAG: hypothetical protein GXP54_02605, partial [Deltaproteobacteria bacterium]|nr:hypothetical protein [Deltaproteobacteria bacterium]
IADRFQSVYGVALSPYGRDHLFKLLSASDAAQSTRRFIKAAVEAMDSVRFYPREQPEQILLNADGKAHGD